MDAERFHALVEAYGGDRKRWPEERRLAADVFAATEDGRALLLEASRLDAYLALSVSPLPSVALIGRIAQSADNRVIFFRKLRQWLVGAGLVGVSLAGGLTGALAVAVIAPSPSISTPDTATAFGNVVTESEIAEEMQ
jgi:hypothetical protein